MDNEKKEPLITRTTYQQQKQEAQPKKSSRLSEKERGRRLDLFYTWAIIGVAVAIVLVFVLAFLI
ncbi:hypothetical protein [Jeotgalibaca caeni]|uniref:hypothetical protein n=1 Tax=Jeotgalibaca caeni TaxID=3028623 RepID=UPI00237E1B9A|nr:hypothetical protein [Jeotgalibaca caeni]MDE1547919.1 hypothetical protein [Jeotgalibaca caeni]